MALFDMMQPNYAWAEQISFNDPDINATFEKYDSPIGNGEIEGYMVKPAGATGKLPAVLVIHENRGFEPIYQGRGAAFGEGWFYGICA